MSFNSKMKNRGISKLDNLVETPDYITPVSKKKKSWNWLKIAIPVTAGLALIIIPISVISANGGFVGSSKSSEHYSSPASEANYDSSENSNGGAPESSYVSDQGFSNLLNDHGVSQNCVIEVYDYSDGYMSPTYTFTGEEVTNIINSISSIDSDISTFNNKCNSPSANRNSAGYLMGINHRLIFKDGNHQLVGNYFSQFATLVIEQSAFDLTGSDAYTIMDIHIEMDYDSSFDETIN